MHNDKHNEKLHTEQGEIPHTEKAETSHLPLLPAASHSGEMADHDLGEQFTRNLLEIIRQRGISDAALSVKAGLNRRFVTDLREGKTRSPKLPNAYKLAEALEMDLRDIMAGRTRSAINAELLRFLEDHSPEEQARFLAAAKALFPEPE